MNHYSRNCIFTTIYLNYGIYDIMINKNLSAFKQIITTELYFFLIMTYTYIHTNNVLYEKKTR